MGTQRNHLYALGTLQLIAIVTIVMGHLWIDNSTFMNSLCASFCFTYSGYFTSRFHRFDGSYGLRDHGRFMWNKLAKFYPMHVLALIICIIAFVFMKGETNVAMKVTLIHLSLLSPWFDDPDIYFGYNAVAWWICVLFFLYLVAPLIVRGLRLLRLRWQVVLIAVLLLLEFIGGYRHNEQTSSLLLSYYDMYEFPPIRILDFATGIVLYNITQCAWWKRMAERLTPSQSTLIELGGIALFGVLFWVEKVYLNDHCFRAFCIQAPSIIVLLMTFVLTSEKMGKVSQLLSIKPLAVMQQYTFEIYLLQVGIFFVMKPLCERLGIANEQQQVLHFVVQNAMLLLAAWACHNFYVKPLSRLLTIGSRKRI
jgi:peptidoglycan/LPS O-acetylase OafA/YrhL